MSEELNDRNLPATLSKDPPYEFFFVTPKLDDESSDEGDSDSQSQSSNADSADEDGDDDDKDVDNWAVNGKRELRRWVKRSYKWNDSILKGWKHVRYLGQGGFGVTALFRHDGGDPQPGSLPAYIKDVVVKQSAKSLVKEARTLEQLTLTGSRHIPELYDRLHRAAGGGNHYKFDPKYEEVQRLFMEYFGDGSTLGLQISESAQLWSFFTCLAKGIAVLTCGKEMPRSAADVAPHWNRPITHKDLYERNIFMDKYSAVDAEHPIARRVAIGDFGISRELEENEKRFNVEVDAVLELGILMWHFATSQFDGPTSFDQVYGHKPIEYWELFKDDFFGRVEDREFSQEFCNLVLSCLNPRKEKRIKAHDLWKRTIAGLRRANAEAGEAAFSSKQQNPRDDLVMTRGRNLKQIWEVDWPPEPPLEVQHYESRRDGYAEWDRIRRARQMYFEKTGIKFEGLSRYPIKPTADNVLGPGLYVGGPKPRVRPAPSDRLSSRHRVEIPLSQVPYKDLPETVTVHVNEIPACVGTDLQQQAPHSTEIVYTKEEIEGGADIQDLYFRMRKMRPRSTLSEGRVNYVYRNQIEGPIVNLKPSTKIHALLSSAESSISLDQVYYGTSTRAKYVDDISASVRLVCTFYHPDGSKALSNVPDIIISPTELQNMTLRRVIEIAYDAQFESRKDQGARYGFPKWCVQLRGQHKEQCLYDGKFESCQKQLGWLIAPYCMSGELDKRKKDRILRLEFRPLPLEPMPKAVPSKLHYLVMVAILPGYSRRDKDVARPVKVLTMACRRTATVQHLAEALEMAAIEDDPKSKFYNRPQAILYRPQQNGSLVSGINLRKISNAAGLVKLEAILVPNKHQFKVGEFRVPVLVWPKSRRTEADATLTEREFFDCNQHTTILELKKKILKQRGKPGGSSRAIVLYMSGPDNAIWKGSAQPLPDDWRVANVVMEFQEDEEKNKIVRTLDGILCSPDELDVIGRDAEDVESADESDGEIRWKHTFGAKRPYQEQSKYGGGGEEEAEWEEDERQHAEEFSLEGSDDEEGEEDIGPEFDMGSEDFREAQFFSDSDESGSDGPNPWTQMAKQHRLEQERDKGEKRGAKRRRSHVTLPPNKRTKKRPQISSSSDKRRKRSHITIDSDSQTRRRSHITISSDEGPRKQTHMTISSDEGPRKQTHMTISSDEGTGKQTHMTIKTEDDIKQGSRSATQSN